MLKSEIKNIFTESAHWADSVIESRCPYVGVYVCLTPVKKTSPMKGKVFFTGDIHTYRSTDGHRDSMTESARWWADSVKTIHSKPIRLNPVP